MKFANTYNAKIGQIFIIGEVISFNPNGLFIEGIFQNAPENIEPGWVYIKDSNSFVPCPVKKPEDLKYYKIFEGKLVEDETKRVELIKILETKINNKTDAKILNDFSYQGVDFYLSLENQFNYKTVYDTRSNLQYPYMVKGKTEYLLFANASDIESFYLAGIQYIQTCIQEGWVEKDALKTKSMQELIEEL